ncbi:MAG: hypothetical protein AAF719_13535, partial [Pseudomonadota bacterium]
AAFMREHALYGEMGLSRIGGAENGAKIPHAGLPNATPFSMSSMGFSELWRGSQPSSPGVRIFA